MEGDGGAVRVRRGVIGVDLGVGLAEKMLRRERDAPSRRGLTIRGARAGRDGAAAPCEAQHAHPRGVLAAHQLLVPAVLAERQQDTRVGDAGAVVGDGHCEVAIGAGDGDVHARGDGPAGVLQNFGEGIGERGGKRPGDALDGAVVDARADGRDGDVVHLRFSEMDAEREAPRPVGFRTGRMPWRTVSGRGAGTRGSPVGRHREPVR